MYLDRLPSTLYFSLLSLRFRTLALSLALSFSLFLPISQSPSLSPSLLLSLPLANNVYTLAIMGCPSLSRMLTLQQSSQSL